MALLTDDVILKIGQAKNMQSVFELNLHQFGIEVIAHLDKCIKLKLLDLSGNKIQIIQNLDSCRELKELNLSNNLIKNISPITLPNLIYLDLKFNQIEHIPRLEHLKKLQILKMGNNQIEVISGLLQFHDLQELNISHNQIKQLKGINALRKLRDLDISYNPLECELTNDLFSNMPKICEFAATETNLDDVTFLTTFPNLNTLTLSNNPAMPELGEFPELANVEVLIIRQSEIMNIHGISELFPSLVYLDLSYNQINSLSECLELKNIENLSELYLNHNPVCEIEDFQGEMEISLIDCEMINGHKLHDPGYRFKIEAENIAKQFALEEKEYNTGIIDEVGGNTKVKMKTEKEVEKEIVGESEITMIKEHSKLMKQMNELDDLEQRLYPRMGYEEDLVRLQGKLPGEATLDAGMKLLKECNTQMKDIRQLFQDKIYSMKREKSDIMSEVDKQVVLLLKEDLVQREREERERREREGLNLGDTDNIGNMDNIDKRERERDNIVGNRGPNRPNMPNRPGSGKPTRPGSRSMRGEENITNNISNNISKRKTGGITTKTSSKSGGPSLPMASSTKSISIKESHPLPPPEETKGAEDTNSQGRIGLGNLLYSTDYRKGLHGTYANIDKNNLRESNLPWSKRAHGSVTPSTQQTTTSSRVSSATARKVSFAKQKMENARNYYNKHKGKEI